jgi:hypothetical protein
MHVKMAARVASHHGNLPSADDGPGRAGTADEIGWPLVPGDGVSHPKVLEVPLIFRLGTGAGLE